MFPLELPVFLVAAILTLLYTWADRFAGGGFGWRQLSRAGGGPLRGHGSFYAGLVLMAVGYVLVGWWGLIFGLSWAVARSMAWKIAGHSAMTPRKSDVPWAFLRHSYVVILLWGAWLVFYLNGGPVTAPGGPFILLALYPVGATLLAVNYTRHVEEGEDIGPSVEIGRGFLFGVLASIVLSTV